MATITSITNCTYELIGGGTSDSTNGLVRLYRITADDKNSEVPIVTYACDAVDVIGIE